MNRLHCNLPGGLPPKQERVIGNHEAHEPHEKKS